MNFYNQINPLVDRVTSLKENINTKAARKTSSLLSILQAPGYLVRVVSCMAIWLQCLSCVPKHRFFFTRSGSSSNYVQKGQMQRSTVSTHQPREILSHEEMLADSIAFIVLAPQAEDLAANAHSQTLPVAARAKSTTVDKAMSPIRQRVRVTRLPRAIIEKGESPSADKPPIHKLAWFSFLSSLAGLAFTFVLSQATGLLVLLSFLAAVVTGGIAIKKINQEPDRFSGKGLARAAIIIVAVMLVAFTLFILAFAGAFG